MKKAYLSREANKELVEYISKAGYEVELAGPFRRVQEGISCHPDLVYCRLVPGEDGLFCGDPDRLQYDYPGDVPYNACSTGKFFIHKLKVTDEALLCEAKRQGLQLVDVPQGYAKCSICVVNSDSIITADAGIAEKCRLAGLDVLEIEPGYVRLPGYKTGFIGGCSGLICEGSILLFNGRLSDHPDAEKIRAFTGERGVNCVDFGTWPLTDIGSIVV